MSSPNPSEIFFDRRPIWIVLIDRMRRGILLGFFFLVFLVLLQMPHPEGLPEPAYNVLCLFFLCVSLWSTNLLPLSITSLIAIAGIPLLGVMNATEAYSFFGNKAVFFILGVFILSAAMIGCGLSARLSVLVLETWGNSPLKLVAGIYLFGLIGSCFMSEHAVAAMLYPIIVEMFQALKLKPKESVFGKSMIFAMAWGCIIGGAATVLGGGRVPLAVEILEQVSHGTHTIGLLEYSVMAFPLVLMMGFAGWFVLIFFFPPGNINIDLAHHALKSKLNSMGRITLEEQGIGFIMVLTLISWFGYGDQLGIANIAIISIALLFIFNLINWKKVEAHVNWAIILMYGGAICLGKAMAESGAAMWLAYRVFDTAQSPEVFLITVAFLSLLFTTFMSNSAVIAILIPPVLGMSPALNIDPALATMTVILPSNFAFLLPIATPASALAFSSKFITLKEMISSGIVLGVIGLVSYMILMLFYWPVIAFK